MLTAVEFDVLWERLGLGPTPVVLRLESPSRTELARRSVAAAGWQALRERGLAGPAGPDPELTRLLHLLARPLRQLELRAVWGHRVRAVAAGRPGAGAVAVRQDATVALTPCTSLPSGLLTAFPPARPAIGRTCTVPADALAAALAAPPAHRRAVLTGRGLPPGEAGLLDRMLTGGRGTARVVALAADRWGVLHRSGGGFGVLDGRHGRLLHTRATDADGVAWSTLASVDDAGLRQRMDGLLGAAALG
ncbi:hypothetical protein BJF78_08040 [Pseudonocardia sp. CNS-139]|nr:hypothetical protein BJF78_08040 [Pseudonocardia sp. CNS-139]